MKSINLLLAQFPGSSALQCLIPDELKRLFYFAMPMKWQTNFINSGQSLHSTTLESMKTYMVYQEQSTDALRRKKGKETKRQGQGRNANFRCSNTNQPTNQSNRNSQSSNSSNSNKKKRKKFSNDDNCPLHGTAHKWGQCHQNQYGDNFRPRCSPSNDANSSHLSSTSTRSTARSQFSNRNCPPAQVYFHQGQQNSRQSDSNSYLSMPSNINYTDSDPGRDRYKNRQRDTYYISHNTDTMKGQSNDHLPEGTLRLCKLNGHPVSLFGLCLFDSGSMSTLINKCAIPLNVDPKWGDNQLVTTTQGTYSSKKYFNTSEIMFPEFCKTRMIPTVHLRTFSSDNSRYDFIVGRDILKLGFILDHAQSRIGWDGLSIPMTVQASTTKSATTVTHFSCMLTFAENYAIGTNKIKQAKYESISPNEVASQCSHLTK